MVPFQSKVNTNMNISAIKIVFNDKTSLNSNDEDYDEEDKSEYCIGGYHPIKLNDILQTRFKIIRKLGWGAFSTVWLCSDLQTRNDLVALKVIKSSESNCADAEIRYLRTVKNNDRIVRLLDNFKIAGRNGIHTCLAFEVLGENVLELIRKSNYKGIPMQDVKTIIRQVLEGLDYLHTSCKLIHTDIKPENVVLCLGEGALDPAHKVCRFSVKIVDLGLASSVNDTCDGTIQTRQYRSPEVIVQAGFGTSADIWSTACLAFELATGDFLFNPHSSRYCSTNLHHLTLMVNLLGKIPKRVALSGASRFRYFTRSGRLRFNGWWRSQGLVEKFVKKFKWATSAAEEFSKFLLPMLAYDQQKRVSARKSLKHKWLRV